jgi:CHAT domain-containing protein/tetratricopeptide (TPR) repeat protein
MMRSVAHAARALTLTFMIVGSALGGAAVAAPASDAAERLRALEPQISAAQKPDVTADRVRHTLRDLARDPRFPQWRNDLESVATQWQKRASDNSNLAFAAAAVEIRAALGNAAGLTAALVSLADLQTLVKDHRRAAHSYQRAARIAANAGLHSDAMRAQASAAREQDATGATAAADRQLARLMLPADADPAVRAFVLIQQGKVLHRRKRFADARRVATQAAAAAAGNLELEADAYKLLGAAADAMKDYEASVAAARTEIAARRRFQPDSLPLAKSLGLLGATLFQMKSYDQAAPVAAEAMIILRKLDQPELRATFAGVYGAIELASDHIDSASALLREAAEQNLVAGRKDRAASAWVYLAQVLAQRSGNEAQVEDILSRARQLAHESGKQATEADALEQQAVQRAKANKLAEALELRVAEVAVRRRLREPQPLIEALIYQAEVERKLGSYDLAIRHFEEAADLARKARIPRDLAESYFQIGVIFSERKLPAQEVRWYQKGLAILAAEKYPAGQVRLLWFLADAYVRLDDKAHALDSLQRSIALLRDLKNPSELAKRLRWAGVLAVDLRQSDQAVAYLAESLQIYRGLEESGYRSDVAHRLGELRLQRGELAPAIELLSEASTIAEQRGDNANAAQPLLSLSRAYTAAGRSAEALEQADRGVRLSRAANDRNQESDLLLQSAIVLEQQRRFDAAGARIDEAIALADRTKDRNIEVLAVRARADLSRLLGQLDRAEQDYLRALALARAASFEFAVAGINNDLGNLLRRRERHADAAPYYQLAYQSSIRQKDLANAAISIRNEGRAWFAAEQYEKALTAYRTTLGIQETLNNRREQGVVHNLIGRVYEGLQRPADAVAEYRIALPLLRGGDGGGDGKLALRELLPRLADLLRQDPAENANAQAFLTEALESHRRDSYQDSDAGGLQTLGRVLQSVERYNDALEVFRQGVRLSQEKQDPSDEAWCREQEGAVLSSLADYRGSLAAYQSALLIRRQSGHHTDRHDALLGVGDAYLQLEQYDDAESEYREALSIAQAAQDAGNTRASLVRLGDVQRARKNWDRALEQYGAVLASDQQARDLRATKETYGRLASVYVGKRDFEHAKANYELAIASARAAEDLTGVAFYTSELADASHNIASDYAAARRLDVEAARIYEQQGRQRTAAVILGNAALAASAQRDFAAAASDYAKALGLYQQSGDRRAIANTHAQIADMLGRQFRYEEADGEVQAAIAMLVPTEGNAAALSSAYIVQGDLKFARSLYPESASWYEKARQLTEQSGDLANARDICQKLSNAKQALGDYRAALDFAQQALDIAKQRGAPDDQAYSLGQVARLQSRLGFGEKSVATAEAALALARDSHRREAEAAANMYLGEVLGNIGRLRPMLDKYRTGLEQFRQLHNQVNTGWALLSVCDAYRALSELGAAFAACEESVAIRHALGDPNAENDATISLANNYSAVGQYAKAIALYDRAYEQARRTGSYEAQAVALGNKVNTLLEKGDVQNAVVPARLAVDYMRRTGIRRWLSPVIGNLGEVLGRLGKYDEAFRNLDDALAIARDTGDRDAEAWLLSMIAKIQQRAGNTRRAIDYNRQSLELALQVDSAELTSTILDQLAGNYQRLGSFEQAIFYRKQAISALQSMRASATSLAKDLQRSLASSKEPIYRRLAEQLIARGRFPEAEIVLSMLKEEEYFDFVRRDASNDPRTTAVPVATAEQPWKQRYDEISTRLVSIGDEFQALSRIPPPSRSAEQQARYTALAADMTVARQEFQNYLASLEAAFRAEGTGRAMSFAALDTRSFAALQGELRGLGAGTVLLHYLVMPDRVHILLTTPGAQVPRESRIKQESLRALIFQYREILQSPNKDPLAAARQLYKILVEPIEADLAQARASVLMLSLDGALRYIPFGALHDGRQYLAQRFAFALYTSAGRVALQRQPNQNWWVAGLGVSRAAPELLFPALPAVPVELGEIVREGVQDPEGVVSGSVSLDEKFTSAALSDVLTAQPPVVHIASHFSFTPGKDADSFLLLGQSGKLSLADFQTGNFPLTGVDLLTLSACQTAVGDVIDTADGKEVESFGAIAQNKGAGAVMATLWSVADGSTGLFMREFYRLHESEKLTKAEAMRRVQVGFISGDLRPDTAPVALRGAMRPPPTGAAAANIAKVAKFTADPKAPFAHPFFWAPFILMGNWL